MKTKLSTKVLREVKEQFFTDEMHSKIYVFADPMPSGRFSSGKPIYQSIKMSKVKRGSKK